MMPAEGWKGVNPIGASPAKGKLEGLTRGLGGGALGDPEGADDDEEEEGC